MQKQLRNWSRREELNTPSAKYNLAALALSYTGDRRKIYFISLKGKALFTRPSRLRVWRLRPCPCAHKICHGLSRAGLIPAPESIRPRRLVVGENAVHIFDTGSNTDLTPNGIAVGNGAAIIDVAVSYDSQTVYALATYNGNSYLAAISVPQLAVTNTMNIAGAATALALGPNALLYVSAPNQILEINPVSLAPTPGGVPVTYAFPE